MFRDRLKTAHGCNNPAARFCLIAYAILAMLMGAAPALADMEVASLAASKETRVRVLIIDEGFKRVPGDDETLSRVDRTSGRLQLGLTSYAGEIEIWRSAEAMYLINDLPLEKYVEGVVQAETARGWGPEALKAQAVAVRTYVLSQIAKSKRPEFHVTSSVLHQVFKGNAIDPAVTEAVRSTRGEILVHNGEVITAYYHSTSIGSTEQAEAVFGQALPYLKTVSAPGKLSPFNVWARRIPLRDISQALGIEGVSLVEVTERTATGRAKLVRITAPSGKVEMPATEFRKSLGWMKLPSTDFKIEPRSNNNNDESRGEVHFSGKGFGHGVGMSQWSAYEMSLEGTGYREILAHFYPGTELRLHENR